MTIRFNADEVLEMAEQIERNGVKYYRKAAESMSDPDEKKLLLTLADMEVEHEKIFARMRADLPSDDQESTTFDPNNESALYLQAMANANVFDMSKDPSEALTGAESMDDILKTAIGMEKESIVFYVGLRQLVPPTLGKDNIENIIKEEMSHITLLSSKLQKR